MKVPEFTSKELYVVPLLRAHISRAGASVAQLKTISQIGGSVMIAASDIKLSYGEVPV